ncbi:hypothetical protein HPB48_023492 [Haemaphysalis longicornis]|uniref:Uncharacterized protein n=1 Tax=Haemaphysalis longicornis TaxID=44386 RepID=A0A9J6H773_HAELO|nr:hypothetical protein HPB48_023492 [Haemaphysalis longicornis]
MLDDDIEVEGGELIKSMTRGGLKFPQPAIVNAVVTAEIVLDKLRSEQPAPQFHALPNQKEALLALTHDLINNNVDFDVCETWTQYIVGNALCSKCSSKHAFE